MHSRPRHTRLLAPALVCLFLSLNTVGAQTVSATDTVFTSLSGISNSIAVNAMAQTISFPQPPVAAYAGTSAQLSATATSGLPVMFKVVSGPATITGSLLTYTGAGPVVLEADQPGNALYAPALPVQQTTIAVVLTEPVGSSTNSVATVISFAQAGTLGSMQVLTQGAAGKDFAPASGGTCLVGQAYLAGATCTAEFTFAPLQPGMRFGGITLQDTNAGTLAQSYVYGLGTGPQLTFQPSTHKLIANGVHAGGLAFDGGGNLFYSNPVAQGSITELTSASNYQTALTLAPVLNVPRGIAIDGFGNLIVAEAGAGNIVQISAANAYGNAKTLSGGFDDPNAVALDGNGNIFCMEGTDIGTVRELTAASGFTTAVKITDGFLFPGGLALGPGGDLFVGDTQHNRVVQITAASGYTSQVVLGSGFFDPTAVAVNDVGDVFVDDEANGAIKKIVAMGGYQTVQTLASGFSQPGPVTLDAAGNAYFAETAGNTVQELDLTAPGALNFEQTSVGTTSGDSPQNLVLINSGNAPLTFVLNGPHDPFFTSGDFSLDASTTCPQLPSLNNVTAMLSSAQSCVYAVDFHPTAAGSTSGFLQITDNNLNGNNALQQVPLNGAGLALVSTATVLTTTPADVLPGGTVTLTATVSVTGQATGAPMGTITFSDNGTVLGSATLTGSGASATATLQASTLAVGSNSISCTYNAVAPFATSPCNTVLVTVSTPDTASLAAFPNPAYTGQTVTITATVKAASGVVPTGTVTIMDGTTAIGAPALNAQGVATLTTSTLGVSTHSLSAVYAGNGSFGAATSPTLQEVVLPGSFAIAVSPATISVTMGQQTSTSVQLTSLGNFAGPLALSFGPLPPYAAASVSPATVSLMAGNTALATLSINTVQQASKVLPSQDPAGARWPAKLAVCALLLPAWSLRRKRWSRLLLVLFAAVFLQSLNGCGGIVGTRLNELGPGTYQIPVIASDAQGATQSATLTVQVSP